MTKYLIDGEIMDKQKAKRIIELECERQWNENQAEYYGKWHQQSDNTKTEYYNEMWADKVEEI